MAVSVRAASSNHSTTGTDINVTAPTGTTTGDIVVVVAHGNNNTTIVPTAVTVSNLTSGSSHTNGPWTTASITPAANSLILLTVSIRNGASTNPATPTISGNGLTWVLVNSDNYDPDSSSRKTIFMFRAMGGSPTTGAVTITNGETDTDADWTIDQFSNVDTSGTNGSGAVVQSAVNDAGTAGTANSLTVTLGAFSNTNNATYGVFANDGPNVWTVGSGYSSISTWAGTDTDGLSEFKSTNSTTVDGTFSNVVGIRAGGIAVEIKASNQFTTDLSSWSPNTTNGETAAVFSRRITATDPSTYHFTLGTSGRWSVIAVTFQNPDPSTIYDVSPSTANGNNRDDSTTNTLTAKTITTGVDNAIHVIWGGSDDGTGGAMTVPAGYTNEGQPTDEPSTIGVKTITPAGATGAQTITATTNSPMMTLSFSIYNTPAAGGITGPWRRLRRVGY